MNRLSTEKRAQIVGCLVEGMSIRATCRVTGAAKNTVTKLLVDLGEACSAYQDLALRGLDCQRIECDEIWSFVYAKDKNLPVEKRDDGGSIWTWVAIDADTKLIPSWLVGQRNFDDGQLFILDLASRLNNRVQLTTDGLALYVSAIDNAFAGEVDYAVLHKLYGAATGSDNERRYSPAVCTGIDKRAVTGDPDMRKVSTSYIERQNLTMRMGMRRFTRLTNGFSKKIENTAHAVSLHFMHYNFCRKHQTLKGQTPAMAAGVEDHVWSLVELASLLDSN